MLNKLSISDLELGGKRLFLRVDFNVPLDGQRITDDTRIRASLPTIRHARDAGARLILASHLGRPKGKVVEGMSLKPVAARLSELLGADVQMAPDCLGEETAALAAGLADGEVLLLENLRFHAGETDNDPAFSEALAAPAELYVNDAFGTAHRAHASTVGITRCLSPCAAGFLLEKEIRYFDNFLAAPDHPFLALLGGAKVSNKIPVIENLLERIDKLLVGGGMAFTFLKAGGLEIGTSLLEKEMLDKAGELLRWARSAGKDILLPHDLVVAEKISDDSPGRTVSADDIPAGLMGLDIGPETVRRWREEISGARTIIWNGPMGVFEVPAFSGGTVEIARAVAASDAVVRDSISHVSTGGGASLDFLAGKSLPAIDALSDRA